MALIKCDECGKDVSTKAASCPNCGNPIVASETMDTSHKVPTQEDSNKERSEATTWAWDADVEKELKHEEDVSRVKLYRKKYKISVWVCLVTLALVVYLAGQIDGNVWNGKNPFIAIVFTIYCISFIVAIVYNIKYRSNQHIVDSTRKKKSRWLYWVSLIWVAITLNQANMVQQRSSSQLQLSTVLIMAFLPVIILWGIPIVIKFIRKPDTERPLKGLMSWKTDRGLIIWGNLAFWFFLAVQFLRFRGM